MIFCFSYTKLNLNIISFILAISIIFCENTLYNSSYKMNLNAKVDGYYENTEESNLISKFTNSERGSKSQDLVKTENNSVWQIEIPKINLVANISEGISSEVLDKYVGHFEETSIIKGNIGLAAHNRGYPVNYFQRIKELEKGDEIYYVYKGIRKRYIVNSKSIIKDTDWKCLENTEDNRITLITCVENQPEYRRCIQAIEQ